MRAPPRTKREHPSRGSYLALAAGILLMAVSFAFLFRILTLGDSPAFAAGVITFGAAAVLLLTIRLWRAEEAARALSENLARSESEKAVAVGDAALYQQHQVAEIRQAHGDLLAHHKFTKKMLQSSRPEEVFHSLLRGVKDGLGFRGTILGIREESGEIVFREDGGGEELARFGAWEEEGQLPAAFWNMQHALISGAGASSCEGDAKVVGAGPAFLMPIARKPSRKCSEVKQCGVEECPSFDGGKPHCWAGGASYAPGPSLSREERRKACVACEMFSPAAMLVVRQVPGSRPVNTETVRSVVSLAGEASLALEVVDLYENLRTMSVTDGLTGLTNHKEFYTLLKKELERARRYDSTVSVLIIDVDDFKKFNDRHGHLAGDIALKKIGELLRSCSRGSDTVARYGGEEFALILPESTPGGALMVAERIKTEIALHEFLPCGPEGGVHLTVSIGIFSSAGGAQSEDQVVSFADEAAYQAKSAGKNRVMVKTHA